MLEIVISEFMDEAAAEAFAGPTCPTTRDWSTRPSDCRRGRGRGH